MFVLVLFAYKDPYPLYIFSKRKNFLKTDNLVKLFLLSALKMPIKFVNSYQVTLALLDF